MATLNQLVAKAKESVFFTAPVLERDLARFLKDEEQHIRRLASEAVKKQVKHIYWVGSGNSWRNLYSGKYLLDKFTTISSDYFMSYELTWRQPRRLDGNAMAFFASFSGNTEDTINALRYAKSRGARTIAIVNQPDCLMGKEADEVIPFHSKALYILPLAAAYLFSLEVARLQGAKEVQKTIDGLFALPPILGRLYRDEEARARELAHQYKDERLFYTLASGPLFGLGYKFGLTVFMENMRVNGSFIETSEFRHGPAEMLDREQPTLVFLIGTDESRPISERVVAFARQHGAKVITYDYADYGVDDPLLAPFVLMVPLQWFAVYSVLLRGIEDLDARAFMGHGSMSQGKGVTWP
ncbi:MAG: SIS domain-containing protein [Firmicutes bacterium]|nr:SIS domain-containing protein [Bacillota bacterium]